MTTFRWPRLTVALAALLCAGCVRATPQIATLQAADPRLDTLHHIAIVTPPSRDDRWRTVYAQVEAIAHEVLAGRTGLQRLERTELALLEAEHGLQMSGAVADESAVRLGRLAGADGLLLFRIDGPTVHDLVLSRPEELPPLVLTGKLLRTQTGEVLWQVAVTVPLVTARPWWTLTDPLRTGALRQAADEALTRMHRALQEALPARPVEPPSVPAGSAPGRSKAETTGKS